MMYIVRVCDARVDRHPQNPLETHHEIGLLPLRRPHNTVNRVDPPLMRCAPVSIVSGDRDGRDVD